MLLTSFTMDGKLMQGKSERAKRTPPLTALKRALNKWVWLTYIIKRLTRLAQSSNLINCCIRLASEPRKVLGLTDEVCGNDGVTVRCHP